MAGKGSSSQDILKSIENFKKNLENIQSERLSQAIISQLTTIKNIIEILIKEQSGKHINEEDFISPVNCQLCFQEQKNLFTLQEHLKTACQAINDPNLKEGKKTSAFQILTSNSIKCNICDLYFDDFEEMLKHRQTEKHKSSAKKKNIHYSKFLYCPACQINVPDNVLQFQNHTRNETHIDRCIEIKKSKGDDVPRNVLLKDGILYLWRLENVCKCLICNMEFEMNSNQMEIHRNNSNHVKNLKDSENEFEAECMKCLVCDDKITGYISILFHLQSSVHVQKAKIAKQPKLPVLIRSCLYCNMECENILALAKHQREDCPEILKENQMANRETKESIESKVVKNNEWYFNCMLCGLETDDKNNFQEHIKSKDHLTKREKFAHAGFGVIQNICDVCQLFYIGSESFADRHRKEHEESNKSRERGRSPKREKSPRSKSVAREKSPVKEKPAARAKSVVREKSPTKERSAPKKKNLGIGEKDNAKALDVAPVFLSGYSEIPNLEDLKNILEVFGEIISAEFQPNGDLCVYYAATSSAEKILSLKEFKAGNNKVTVSRQPKRQKAKTKESSALEELVAAVRSSLLETANPIKSLLSELYPCTEFDKKFLINPEAIFECSQTLCKISDSHNDPLVNNEIGEICKNTLKCSSFSIVGSRACNLNMRDCSLDIFLTFPNLKLVNNPLNDLIEKSLLEQFSANLKKDGRFDNVQVLDNIPIGPLISCRKIDSKINCLISFKNQLVIEKTEILKNHIEMDIRVRHLLLLIKAWAHNKKLIADDKFTTYSLFMMVIFFLQNDEVKVLPKYSQMTGSPFLRSLFMKQGINPALGQFSTKNLSSVPELFMNFFKFYLSFDFKQAISLPFCKAVSRVKLPNEPAIKNSAICIMDVLESKLNLTKNVSEETLNEFLGYGQSLFKAF